MDIFKITLPADTQQAAELFIAQIDKQIAELSHQIGLLQDLRHHSARTFNVNRPGPGESFIKQLTAGADRRVFEGDKQDAFEREVAKISLADSRSGVRAVPADLAGQPKGTTFKAPEAFPADGLTTKTSPSATG